MPPPLLRVRSDWCSTGCNRPSGGRNILGSVDVEIVIHAAAGAIPIADACRHRFQPMPPCRAGLAARETAIQLHQGAPVPAGLVLQLADQLSPRRSGHGAAVSPAAQHPPDAQVFDGDPLVLLDQPCCELVQVIPARVGDPGVDARADSNSARGLRPKRSGQPAPGSAWGDEAHWWCRCPPTTGATQPAL